MCICEVRTYRTLALGDSRILDMICGIVTSDAVNLSDQNDDKMTQSNDPDSSKVWFYRVYTHDVERDGCISHPMSL